MKAKSDIDFDLVDTDKAFRRMNDPKIQRPTRINGFDTETADGKLFCLSFAFDGYGGATIMADDGEIESERVFDILTDYKCRNSHNMWYNLSYDAGVICSHVLTDKELQILKYTNTVQTDKWTITYVPGKFLKIKDKGEDRDNGHSYVHYDASQYFFSSLDKASKEYLGDKKEESVDTSKFGLDEEGNLNQYIKDNYNDIEYYARKDAELVRDLWDVFVDTALEFDIPINKPFSTGYMAQQYFEKHGKQKPGVVSSEMQKMAWESYAGGRFEIFERGSLGEVTGLDINSAYPYEMTKLPDPSTLHWHYLDDPVLDKVIDLEYGMVDITVTTTPGKIQPFPVKDEVRIFPRLKDYRLTVTLDELQMAVQYDMIQDVRIHKAVCGESHQATKYPFQMLEDIYHERKTLEADGKMLAGLLLKIVMNSLYGKFIQTTPKREIIENQDKYEFNSNERPLISAILPEELEDELIVETLEAGKLFNPFLASHICARTRRLLVDFVYQNNLVDDLVMLATDCVMVKGNISEEDIGGWIETGDMSYRNRLGKWDIEYQGDAFVIAPGVYEVTGSKDKLKTRGFNQRHLDGGLLEHIENNDGVIEVERPLSLGMAVHQGKPFSDIGKFMKSEKTIKPDMDNKRVWKQDASWNGLMNEGHDSWPITVGDGAEAAGD